jgi:calcineurin-like phosphoesterase family protein
LANLANPTIPDKDKDGSASASHPYSLHQPPQIVNTFEETHTVATTNYFYISDIHFGYQTDTNPIRRTQYQITFSHYKFNGPNDYDNRLCQNWNNVVKENDHVFILGDVSCRDVKSTVGLLKGLKGQKHLILGNHDYQYMHD